MVSAVANFTANKTVGLKQAGAYGMRVYKEQDVKWCGYVQFGREGVVCSWLGAACSERR